MLIGFDGRGGMFAKERVRGHRKLLAVPLLKSLRLRKRVGCVSPKWTESARFFCVAGLRLRLRWLL